MAEIPWREDEGEARNPAWVRRPVAPFEARRTGSRSLEDRLEERVRQIAHALHDDVQQLLAVVAIEVEDLGRDTASPSAAPRVAKVLARIDEVADRVRDLAHELSPTLLDDLGLLPALESLGASVSRRGGLEVRVSGEAPPDLDPALALVAYRAAQESLTNAIKHSRARHVAIRVEANEALLLAIEDDGDGFDVEAVSGAARRGLGLSILHDRVADAGGSVVLRSGAGCGTAIRIRLPLARVAGKGAP